MWWSEKSGKSRAGRNGKGVRRESAEQQNKFYLNNKDSKQFIRTIEFCSSPFPQAAISREQLLSDLRNNFKFSPGFYKIETRNKLVLSELEGKRGCRKSNGSRENQWLIRLDGTPTKFTAYTNGTICIYGPENIGDAMTEAGKIVAFLIGEGIKRWEKDVVCVCGYGCTRLEGHIDLKSFMNCDEADNRIITLSRNGAMVSISYNKETVFQLHNSGKVGVRAPNKGLALSRLEDIAELLFQTLNVSIS